MLFGYPVEATQENWLHDCLSQILTFLHARLDADVAAPIWPDIVPAEHRAALVRRTSLRDALENYRVEAVKLTGAERAIVADAFLNQNLIPELLAKDRDCLAINQLPVAIQGPIRTLFECSFKLLTSLGIRDKQYKKIYSSIGFKVCPFCGCEYFDAPCGPREALDHYLAESRYPFAAANLKNLVPMGAKCNSKYKLAKDILRTDDGLRRTAFYPYSAPGLQVSVDLSQPQNGPDGALTFDWSIEFLEPSEEVETWNAVFAVRERYKRDILDVYFKDWLREFQFWNTATHREIATDVQLLDAIDDFSWYQEQCFKDMAFLKASVFRMLHKHCLEGNQRVLHVMRDLAGMAGMET